MTISPFDHPFLGGLLGDEEIAGYFSAQADIRAMLAFEAALALAEAEHGVIPAETARRIEAVCAAFVPEMGALRIDASTDGVVVPALVRQLRHAAGGEHAAYVHFGATSQDVIDTSLMLRLKPVLPILDNRLSAMVRVFADLDRRFGSNVLMGHTRMQPAIAITVRDRVAAWRQPCQRNQARLHTFMSTGLALQFGGAAGTLEALGTKAAPVRASLAARLGLVDAPQWHSQRDGLAELAGILSLITGNLGKFGTDVTLLAQAGNQIKLARGGASSAMPHKQNPVSAEILVSLARFNATLVGGMHNALVHEQERSGAAWTLEWLILPQMVCACAAALRHGVELGGSIGGLGQTGKV